MHHVITCTGIEVLLEQRVLNLAVFIPSASIPQGRGHPIIVVVTPEKGRIGDVFEVRTADHFFGGIFRPVERGLREGTMTDKRSAMIEITTKSSIKVNA
jgi:hypothetical protein